MSLRDDLGPDDRDEPLSLGRKLLIGAAVLGGVALVVLLVMRLMTKTEVKRKAVPDVVQLRLIAPPPPPPPPPPPKPIEQPKLKQEVQRAETPLEKPADPRPASPSPPGPPALDAKGAGPADGFGLGGKPGGSDFGGGGGGGGGGTKFGLYAGIVQSHVQNTLQRKKSLQNTRYRLGAQIWLTPDGGAERVELIGSTGDAELDKTLRDTLLKMPRVPQAPPQDLPQPVVLQVSSS